MASFFAETEAEFDELMGEVLDGLWEQAQRAAVDPSEAYNAPRTTETELPE